MNIKFYALMQYLKSTQQAKQLSISCCLITQFKNLNSKKYIRINMTNGLKSVTSALEIANSFNDY